MQRNHNHHQGTNKVSPATVYGTAFIWLNPPCMLVECQNFLVMISYMQLFLLCFSRAICVMDQVGDILPQIQQLQEGIDTYGILNSTRNTCMQQPLAQGNDLRMQIFAFPPLLKKQ